MKTLYKINLILIIANVILGFTIYLGLLFMIITGITQIIMYTIYLTKWSNISKELKIPFIKYGTLTAITLIGLSLGIYYESSDFLVPVTMIASGILAFYFLYLSKKQYEFYKINLNTNELLNS